MNPHYTQVALRAVHRCEYCHAPEAVFNFPMEVEHIVPVSRGGDDSTENWALACRACNLYKATHVNGRDPETRAVVRLFHPRQDRWRDHFQKTQTQSAVPLSVPNGDADCRPPK